MTLRCLEKLTLKFGGQTVHFDPGSAFAVTPNQAKRVLDKFPGKVEVLTLAAGPANEPLSSGWLIAYRDQAGRLRGGSDEREVGTVQVCEWTGSGWRVTLTNGEIMPLRRIVSVGQTDAAGQVIAAWSTREHGLNGRENEDC